MLDFRLHFRGQRTSPDESARLDQHARSLIDDNLRDLKNNREYTPAIFAQTSIKQTQTKLMT